MTDLSDLRARIDAYDFRDVHPHVVFGTASDRYAGWIGQIYPETYATKARSRKRTLGGATFEEQMLPVASVADYFGHFEVLELDFTFYRPLLEPDGEPSTNYRALEQYAQHAPPDARFFLKAPQAFFARTLRRGGGRDVHYESNPTFLDADAYVRRFHEPAVEILEDRLSGVLFEQEYQRVQESPDPEANMAELDGFFTRLPTDVQPHVELRSPHLLVTAYFDWLASRGIGFVFSHWTWLPQIREQWRLCGGRFTAGDGTAIARLLTPQNVPYAKAYAAAYPFDRAVPEIAETQQAREMVLDAVALTYQAERQAAQLAVIANNRAWGNAPALAQAIAYRIADEEEKRQT